MEVQVSSEVQKICALFHHGWIPKKDAGYFDRNTPLYREVQNALEIMGYELINPPYCDWYIIRLRKEFDLDAFDQFSKFNKGLNRKHLALIFILYTKLIFPKKAGMVEWTEDLSITIDELSLNYGAAFQNRRTNPRGAIESLVKALSKYYFIIAQGGKLRPGPSLYMLHNELMDNVQEAILLGLADKFNKLSINNLEEEEKEEDEVDD